jgi:hypothetical protein
MNEMQQGKVVRPLRFKIIRSEGIFEHHFKKGMALRNLDGLKLVPL